MSKKMVYVHKENEKKADKLSKEKRFSELVNSMLFNLKGEAKGTR